MLARPLCAQCSALSRRTLTTALSASMWTARAQSAPSLAYLAALPRGLPASSSLRTLATSSALSQGYTSPRAGSKGRARRPPPELPELRTLSSRAPAYLAILLAVLSSWSAFLFYTYNNDRAQSTIVKSLMFILRNSQEIRELIGDRVRLETLFGQFSRVKGSINLLNGYIDLQFRIVGSQGTATVIFTSVRKDERATFQVVRWKVIRDSDGTTLDLSKFDPKTL